MRVVKLHPSGYLTFTARMPLFKQSTHLNINGGNLYPVEDDMNVNNLSPTHEGHIWPFSSTDDADAYGTQVDDTDRPTVPPMQDVSNAKVASTIQSDSLTPDAPDLPDEVPVIYSRNSDSFQSAYASDYQLKSR
ncbi:hypothetical protein B0H10DRAFT_2060570, partial [Mycena sp. CBHHK59/15]